MIVTTSVMFLVQTLIVGGIIWTTPEDCPRKYMVTKDNGGVLEIPADIMRYCELDYGAKWKLRNKYKEKK